jgi:hypothetical protein
MFREPLQHVGINVNDAPQRVTPILGGCLGNIPQSDLIIPQLCDFSELIAFSRSQIRPVASLRGGEADEAIQGQTLHPVKHWLWIASLRSQWPRPHSTSPPRPQIDNGWGIVAGRIIVGDMGWVRAVGTLWKLNTAFGNIS